MSAVSTVTLRRAQMWVFWLLWGAYASYYLCRVNFAVAQPALLQEFPTWTSAQIGTIPSVFAAFYAAGQIFNGILGQRFGTRRTMTLAMLVAGITNVLFAFTSSFETMRVLWAINGWFQSAGWTLMMSTLANWNTSRRRGMLTGKLSTCYTVGNVLSWLLAGFLCDAIGWRAAFLVPGLFMFVMMGVFAVFLRDTPEEASLPPVRDDLVPEHVGDESSADAMHSTPSWASTWQAFRLTLANRIVCTVAVAFLVQNAVRYSFMNWMVQYMVDFHGRTIRDSALTAIVIPLVGSVGALTAGWASDTLFGRHRAPVCVVMMLGLGVVCGAMAFVPQGSWGMATVLLAIAGFLVYGPDMLIGVATVDLSHPRATAIASGLTMCLGSLGAIFSGAGIGWFKDIAYGNWPMVFWLLAAMSLFPALLMASIWKVRPKGVIQ